jgi:hypothetical protein
MTASMTVPNRGQTLSSIISSVKAALGSSATLDVGVGSNEVPLNAYLGALAYADNIVITKDDVGLGSVDNTSDADKPISTDMQAALDLKVALREGYALSKNDFSDALKVKLEGITPTAYVQTWTLGALAYRDSISYDEIEGTPAIPVQVNANWQTTATDDLSYIQNKPNLATVATSGAYADLQGKPNLAAYAEEWKLGAFAYRDALDYAEISNTPAPQVNADWNSIATDSPARILNKPSLATIATSGLYADLQGTPDLSVYAMRWEMGALAYRDNIDYSEISNTPTIPAAPVQSNWSTTSTSDLSYIVNKPTLGTASAKDVATSGDASATQVVLGSDSRLTNARDYTNAWALGALAFRDGVDYTELSSLPTIPAAQVQSDWSATSTSDLTYIKNKPTLGTAASKNTGTGDGNVPLLDSLGKLSSNVIPFGTTISSVAYGNHTHTGYLSAVPAASSIAIGGIKTGYTATGKNYPVALDSDSKAYVNVPWTDTDTTYSFSTGLSVSGTTVTVAYGATSTTACQGNDVRLSDTRDPKPHTLLSHTVSGLTTGHVLQATGASTYGFAAVPTASTTVIGGVQLGYTSSGKNYAVQLDGSSKAYVNVPWTDSDTTYSNATSAVAGLVKVHLTQFSGTVNSVSTTSGRTYPVQIMSTGEIVVNVPWSDTDTNTTYSAATTSVDGLIKLGSSSTQSATAASIGTTNGRTYLSQVNSSGQLVVNVPWTDTDTNTTYTFASGTTNGAFSVTPSGGTATSVSIYGLGSAAYTASTNYAAAGHTHNYAASASAGGNASRTNAIATAAASEVLGAGKIYFDTATNRLYIHNGSAWKSVLLA